MSLPGRPCPPRVCLVALTVAIASAGGLRAQAAETPSRVELARIQALADSGRVDEAREALGAWHASGRAPGGEEASRARFLRARLTADPDSAEVDYVWVAIEGGSAFAPEAWLRLAQLRLLRGDPERALADLERLRTSYPGDPRTAESWLWTGHALEVLGDLEAACEAWVRAAPEVAGTGGAVREARAACDPGSQLFAVQLGAFGARSGAETLRARVEEAGIAAYVMPRGGGGLHRVRTGRFVHMTSAARYAERLRQQGFEAVVVLAANPAGSS